MAAAAPLGAVTYGQMRCMAALQTPPVLLTAVPAVEHNPHVLSLDVYQKHPATVTDENLGREYWVRNAIYLAVRWEAPRRPGDPKVTADGGSTGYSDRIVVCGVRLGVRLFPDNADSVTVAGPSEEHCSLPRYYTVSMTE